MSPTTERPVMQPDAKHPITIEPNPERVTVTVAGEVVAEIGGYLAFYPDRVDSSG